MKIACLDLEGVLIPEIWLAVAEQTGIEALRQTTRDIQDYEQLMQLRLEQLHRHGILLPDIQRCIDSLEPLPGAVDFIGELRQDFQVVILSDTFYEFATGLIQQLHNPLLLCHRLVIDAKGGIESCQLRQQDAKRCAVRAFKSLNYPVCAAGDSLNDLGMLDEADFSVLFRSRESLQKKYPHYPATDNYTELLNLFRNFHNG